MTMMDEDLARVEYDDAEYAKWERAHSDALEAEAFASWVADQCEGHESLRGDAMGREEYCDGTCRPADERSYDAWVEALENE